MMKAMRHYNLDSQINAKISSNDNNKNGLARTEDKCVQIAAKG